MFTAVKGWLSRRAANWLALSNTTAGFWSPNRPGAVRTPAVALTVSPFWCGVRLYQTTLGSLPLVVYRKDADGGRTRATDDPSFYALHDRPNPAMSRAVLWELAVKEMFLEGDSFIQVRKTVGGDLIGLYPIPCRNVEAVLIDSDWNKSYVVRTLTGREVYTDDEVIHTFLFSLDGVRGVPLLRYAAEAMGLHRQVLESANAFYSNAVRPSGYLKYPGKLDKDGIEVIKKWWKEEYSGTANTGKLPVTQDGGEFVQLGGTTAEDAQIIEALGASVDDVARWLGVSPLLLYNLARGTYSNLAADNQSFYQRSLRPLLDKIELEVNHKVYGEESDLYAEFLTDAVLRGDPLTQAQINQIGVQCGYLLRSEIRAWQNLPPVPDLDKALMPKGQKHVGDPAPTPPADPTLPEGANSGLLSLPAGGSLPAGSP